MSARHLYQQVAAQCSRTGEHIWQALGLGRAPFRSTEMLKTDEPGPCPLGECYVCGTKLENNFVIRDADDAVFVVGCECVKALDSNDTALVASVTKLKAAHDARLKAAKAAENLEQWKFDNFELYSRMERIKTHSKVAAIFDRLLTKGGLTDKQYESITENIARYEIEHEFYHRNPEYGFSVPVGTRRAFSGFVASSVLCGSGSRMTIINTAEGYQLKTFDLDARREMGELVTLTGTVQRHDEYRGELQLLLRNAVLAA